MVISSEKSELKNVVDRTNRNIMETINNIHHSEFYMGVSHGPSWLAWGLGKKVVMVSGFTGKYHEMQEDCTRIINETVCHDCLSDLNCHFDRGNFFWCPRNKKFECTTTIKSEDVICEIKKLL
jgi:autotransporter strand-loop-strand O-heptosyltransferase